MFAVSRSVNRFTSADLRGEGWWGGTRKKDKIRNVCKLNTDNKSTLTLKNVAVVTSTIYVYLIQPTVLEEKVLYGILKGSVRCLICILWI